MQHSHSLSYWPHIPFSLMSATTTAHACTIMMMTMVSTIHHTLSLSYTHLTPLTSLSHVSHHHNTHMTMTTTAGNNNNDRPLPTTNTMTQQWQQRQQWHNNDTTTMTPEKDVDNTTLSANAAVLPSTMTQQQGWGDEEDGVRTTMVCPAPTHVQHWSCPADQHHANARSKHPHPTPSTTVLPCTSICMPPIHTHAHPTCSSRAHPPRHVTPILFSTVPTSRSKHPCPTSSTHSVATHVHLRACPSHTRLSHAHPSACTSVHSHLHPHLHPCMSSTAHAHPAPTHAK